MVPKEVPYFPEVSPLWPLFFRSVPERSFGPQKVTKKSPKATKPNQKGAKKTPKKRQSMDSTLSLKKSKQKNAGVPPCFLCLFGAPNVGRVREPRGLKIIEKVKLKIGGRSALFLMVFGAPNLGRVQEPRGLKLIEKVKLKKWRAFRPVFHVFLVLRI